jgi:hypothetical protein
LFGFHGNLFYLGFTLESVVPSSDDIDDILGEELEDQGKRDAEGSNQGGQDNGGTYGPSTRSQSFSLGNINQASANDQYNQKDQDMEAPLGENCSPEGAIAYAVYQLPLQKGLGDQNGAFVWDKTPTIVVVNGEVKKFWYSEKMLKNNLSQMIEEAAEEEVELPDDIMPDFNLTFPPRFLTRKQRCLQRRNPSGVMCNLSNKAVRLTGPRISWRRLRR